MAKKVKAPDFSDLDTKQRILETAMNLFAVKGFDGASIREIAGQADVNVAALNYHFKSKEGLRQEIIDHVITKFKIKMASITNAENAAQYAVKVFESMTENPSMCLNQFKLIIEADCHACDQDPYPMGYEHFSAFLAKELKPSVSEADRLWLVNMVFSYIVHISVMSSTSSGTKAIDKFFPDKKGSIPKYIKKLVESLIRDLNNQN